MSVYKDSLALPAWAVDDIRAFLLTYGRAPGHLEVRQLESWWFNLVLKIEADGDALVLRRYGATTLDEVRWELAVLDHLRKHDFPTIRPLTRADLANEPLGEFLGKPAILYPFIEGHHAHGLDWEIAMPQAVQAIARLHRLTQELAIPHPRVRSGTESRRLLQEFLDFTTQRGIRGDELALQQLVTHARDVLLGIERRIAQVGADLPRGVVHHDAHYFNVLFREDEMVALIDFDDAYEGYLLADLAALVVSWAGDWDTGDPLHLEAAVRVMHAYERERPLTWAERELLPDFVLLFLLGDGATDIQDALERGDHANTAVQSAKAYQRFLHHLDDAEWFNALRGAV